ncbi:UNVERIFIED_CONTAM: hypothetical protein GTU68_028823 [Idotea baltica]|nr:hypothetical protein [Idotea baltica]
MSNSFQNNLTFAQQLDAQDELKNFRNRFHLPVINGKETVYFTGNSLGLQPKATADYISSELNDWAAWGVEGHFHGKIPWFKYHHSLTPKIAKIVGAKEHEVTVMNSLTVNLHLLMVSFYRPTKQRYKIIMEGAAFCSDHYAMQSQVEHHGFTADEAIVYLEPREGEHTLRIGDILKTIDDNANDLAMVMLGGVNYYTGQLFNMEAITKKAHEVGAIAGFDLAHAVGNAILNLHDWKVDFATWCSYKYLNSSPGGVSGIYVNEKHAQNPDTPRFAGWWGYNEATRFEMKRPFDPTPTADGWQLSNVPILLMAAHNASLDIFEEVGMPKLRAKSDLLTAYLEFLIEDVNSKFDNSPLEIITPKNPKDRAAQISILTDERGKSIFDALTEANVIVDWREPNVIRLAPVPLYNSFEDVYKFGAVLQAVLVG